MASGGDFKRPLLLVASWKHWKKATKSNHKVSNFLLRGGEHERPSLFVTAIEESLQPLCSTTKFPPEQQCKILRVPDQSDGEGGSPRITAAPIIATGI